MILSSLKQNDGNTNGWNNNVTRDIRSELRPSPPLQLCGCLRQPRGHPRLQRYSPDGPQLLLSSHNSPRHIHSLPQAPSPAPARSVPAQSASGET